MTVKRPLKKMLTAAEFVFRNCHEVKERKVEGSGRSKFATESVATHILDEREALVLVVVELLLPPQVLVLGGLKTHGYHLRAGQHLDPLLFVRS